MIHTKLPLAIRVLQRLLDETEDRSNTRYGDLTSNERDALEVLMLHAEAGQ